MLKQSNSIGGYMLRGFAAASVATCVVLAQTAPASAFLLIRDTPSEEVYVLNMFRMRGSRL